MGNGGSVLVQSTLTSTISFFSSVMSVEISAQSVLGEGKGRKMRKGQEGGETE